MDTFQEFGIIPGPRFSREKRFNRRFPPMISPPVHSKHRTDSVGGRGRERGAGSKEPGARSMCKTRQSGPVHSRGGATIGTGPAENAFTPAPLPKTEGSDAPSTPNHPRRTHYRASRAKRPRLANQNLCHPSAPSHNHDRLDPPAAQRFSAFFPNSGWGPLIEFLPENRPVRARGIEFLKDSVCVPNNHFSIFRCIP